MINIFTDQYFLPTLFLADLFFIDKVSKPTHVWQLFIFSAGNYLFKVNNRNTKTRYEIC